MNRYLVFLLSLLFHVSSGYAQSGQCTIEKDLINLRKVKEVYGDSSTVYNDLLINVSSFYGSDTTIYAYLHDITAPIIQNNHIIRNKYGLDSEPYRRLMTALDGYLTSKYICKEKYKEYSPQIIASIQELEPLLPQTRNNTLEFATILLSLYTFYVPNDSLSLHYAEIKFNETAKHFDKQSSEYIYAIDNIIEHYIKCNKYDKAEKLLQQRKFEINGKGVSYNTLICSCLYYLSPDAPINLVEYLLKELSTKYDNESYLFVFYVEMASHGALDKLQLYEDVYLSQLNNASFKYQFYNEVGRQLVHYTNYKREGIDYFLQAEQLLPEIPLHISQKDSISIGDEPSSDTFSQLSTVYASLHEYDKAAFYQLKIADYFRTTNRADHTEAIRALGMSTFQISRYYTHHHNEKRCRQQIEDFISQYHKAGGTLKLLDCLYTEMVQHADFSYCDLFNTQIVSQETDLYALYEYYLCMGSYLQRNKQYSSAADYYLKALDCAYQVNDTDLLYFKGDDKDYTHYGLNVAYCYYSINQLDLYFKYYELALHDMKKHLGIASKDYLNSLDIYIKQCINSDRYDNTSYFLDEAIASATAIFGKGSKEASPYLIAKARDYMLSSEYDQANAIISSMKTSHQKLDDDVLSELLILEAFCDERAEKYDLIYHNFQSSLPLLSETYGRAKYIEIVANILKYSHNPELSEKMYGYIDTELGTLCAANTPDSTLISYLGTKFFDTYQYTYPAKAREYLEKGIAYIQHNRYEDLFVAQHQLVNAYVFEMDKRLPLLQSNQALVDKHLRHRKDLFYLLQRDWGKYYLDNFDQDKGFSYYEKCYKYYADPSTDFDSKVDFISRYAMDKQFYKDFKKALQLYQELEGLYAMQSPVNYAMLFTIDKYIIQCYLALGDASMAQQQYNTYMQRLEKDPSAADEFDTHFLKGQILHLQHKDTQALECYQQAMSHVKWQGQYDMLNKAVNELQKVEQQ